MPSFRHIWAYCIFFWNQLKKSGRETPLGSVEIKYTPSKGERHGNYESETALVAEVHINFKRSIRVFRDWIQYKRLNAFAHEHADADFLLWNGNRALFKREMFQNFLNENMNVIFS